MKKKIYFCILILTFIGILLKQNTVNAVNQTFKLKDESIDITTESNGFATIKGEDLYKEAKEKASNLPASSQLLMNSVIHKSDNTNICTTKIEGKEVRIVGKNSGITKVDINFWIGDYYFTKKYNVTVIDEKEKEEQAKQQQEQKNEAETNYKNAYKTKLSDTLNFSAQEIKQYILSDYKYNSSAKVKSAAKSYKNAENKQGTVLYKWMQTLNGARGISSDEDIGALADYLAELSTATNASNRTAVVNSHADELNEMVDAINQNFQNWQNRINALIVDGENRGETVFDDVLDDVGVYKPNDIDSTSAGEIEDATSKILTVISNVGVAVAVIMLAVIGIKYMMGSVEEKAEYKKDLIPYVVGACILFGITTLMKIIISIGEKINSI